MRLLIDMNLSPRWVDYLATSGHDARHWSRVGEITAPDSQIMQSAREGGEVVLTNDLDFGTLLALTGDDGPSVLPLPS